MSNQQNTITKRPTPRCLSVGLRSNVDTSLSAGERFGKGAVMLSEQDKRRLVDKEVVIPETGMVKGKAVHKGTHTQGKLLKTYKDSVTPGLLVSSQGKMLLGQVNNEADFDRVVLCWNAHDELVALAKEVSKDREVIASGKSMGLAPSELAKRALALLDKLEEGE